VNPRHSTNYLRQTYRQTLRQTTDPLEKHFPQKNYNGAPTRNPEYKRSTD